MCLKRGGFCHRMPLAIPMPVQGPLGQTDMLIISGFGECQKELCPKWTGTKCAEAESDHVERLRLAQVAAEEEAKKDNPDEGSRIIAP